MKWFDCPLVPIPPCEVLEVNIPFPEKYRSAYDNIRARFIEMLGAKLKSMQAAWDDKSEEERDKSKRPEEVDRFFLASLSRQLLVATSIPCMLEYWLQPDTIIERFLAAEFGRDHLDANGHMLPSCPLLKVMSCRQDIAKFTYLDRVLEIVKKENRKLLIFSMFISVYSTIREVCRGFSYTSSISPSWCDSRSGLVSC